MPASRQSLRLTDSYRSRLRLLVDGVQRDATEAWGGMSWDDLRGSYEPIAQRVNLSIQRAQTAAVRLTAAYITAYLSSELGRRQRTVSIPSKNYVGRSYGDLPLDEALQKPLVSLLTANGKGEPDPMGTGLKALRVNIDLNVKHAGRKALQDVIEADERIVGWRRAVKGTCAACAGLATEAASPPGTPLDIHPGCQCVSEAVVTPPSPEVLQSFSGTADDVFVLERYMGSVDSFAINRGLRSAERLGGRNQQIADGIDAAMEHAGPMGQSVRTFRGVSGSPESLGFRAGESFDDLGFASTTADASWARQIRSGYGDFTVFDLTVDPRVKAIWGANPSESELLLQRGCRVVVESVEKVGEGEWRVKATVLPPK